MSDPHVRAAIPMVRVQTIDAALPLYTALGFVIGWEHRLAPDAPRLVSLQHGEVALYLTEHPVPSFGAVVYLVTHGLDALVARAMAAGIRPTFGPEDRPWGNREAYFRDADGNVLRFGEAIAR
ncbi:MAG: glyoxalase superfamily protein [Gemmatimonadota bacterium]|nr:glyoxalase superfamily protein [Gemmatimonadota bacterium]